jgi:Asp-tRNA(Asn)/Glu-tRNA(Gln) amidotransferase A subunit family amidase
VSGLTVTLLQGIDQLRLCPILKISPPVTIWFLTLKLPAFMLGGLQTMVSAIAPKQQRRSGVDKKVIAYALNRARGGCAKLRVGMMELMDAFGLDLWLSPAAPGPAPKGLDHTGDAIMCVPWTHSGLPALNLPAGKNSDGLPLGLQVVARWYADEELLDWSRALEQALQN